ncbi:uncharacterized protein LOC132316053 isoform X2 [Cornus florida]|uniref:uncharacterized protein LOC132316053 isoform X2 n=1 Tax=Cornus florida TaxID=4283 RepID=UPI0028A14A1B|nr:uncharacterized protein LOC132316053 isoform X2 [Cornus florida]
MTVESQEDTEASKSAILDKLENKKKELFSAEEIVQDLEKKWAQVQENALKQPSPGVLHHLFVGGRTESQQRLMLLRGTRYNLTWERMEIKQRKKAIKIGAVYNDL